ncbi:MAG: SDR family oxidoreductase [Pseudorhodoplanes sp.]|nr:SDR family oxidoreductase [Pseudorhodoplanes sp.]
MRLDGQVALIIGGSKGIGAAIVRRLAAEGAAVTMTYQRSTDAAEAVKAELDPSRSASMKCDLADSADVARCVDETVSRFGRIDILCVNGGIIGPLQPVAEVDEADFAACVNTDLVGVFRANRAVLPYMIARGYGRIINTSSIFGKKGWANYGAYCAAKAGVIALTQSIALENAASGITANCICPGATDSDMLTFETEYWAAKHGMSVDAMMQEWLKLIPAGRLQSPEEQAALVAFLASPEASYVTGVAISSAGGMEVM